MTFSPDCTGTFPYFLWVFSILQRTPVFCKVTQNWKFLWGIGKGGCNWEKKNILMVLYTQYSILNSKFTGRGFPVLLIYRNSSKREEFMVSKLILLEPFPVHYTVMEPSFICRQTRVLGSVSKGVVLPIIKLCTKGSHLNSTLLILCKTEPYWFLALSQPCTGVTHIPSKV